MVWLLMPENQVSTGKHFFMAHFKPKSILNHALIDVTVYKCLQIAIIKSSITEFLISHSIVKHKMCKLAIKEGEKIPA